MIYNNWLKTSLGQLGTFRNGINFNYTQEGAGVAIVKVKDFGDLFFVPSRGMDELNSQLIEVPDNQILKEGDTVIIRSNGNRELVGRSLYFRGSNKPVTFSGFCIRFRPALDKIHPLFATYFIKSPFCRARFTAYGSGTGIQNLNQGILSDIPVPLPPLSEQQAIAHILGSLDDKIELNRQMNETLEGITRALFKSWFVDFDPVRAKMAGHMPYGMGAEAAALFPDGFEDSVLGEIPRGWRITSLPEIIEVNPPRSLHHGLVSPYLEMSNVSNTSARVLAWKNRTFSSGTKFINGDTLVARITPCLENGKTAFVDFLAENEVGWGSTEYIVMRSRPPLPVEYSYFLARSDNFRTYAIRNMTGTSGRQRVPTVCFNSYFIAEPSPECAKIFGKFAQSMMQAIKQNDEESQTLVTIRDTLLPKLLSGEVRVRDVEREVGVVL
ncbi:MAG: restriction endonuclease subunit S [Ktedonobacteraceae bacterium]|nr:restriction endonuclease subunit S [Ktedonobacteraceae bacterium]